MRQGDPLSSFLFILVIGGLHVAIEDAKANHLFEGVQVGNRDMRISHLFYADDVIILGDWIRSNITNIVRFLHCFFL